MRVHLIKERTILTYCLKNSGGRFAFEEWLSKIADADWSHPSDMKQSFRTVDFLGRSSSRVVFDIGGNKYRMICKYAFGVREIHLFVCWIGTHAEYDKLCKNNLQYAVWLY